MNACSASCGYCGRCSDDDAQPHGSFRCVACGRVRDHADDCSEWARMVERDRRSAQDSAFSRRVNKFVSGDAA
jgi:hypothetical protein